MPYANPAISAGEINAYNGDNQIVVGHNVLRDATQMKWTVGGTQAEADVSSPIGYAYRAHDGRGSVPTFAAGFSATSVLYFNIQIPASTIDTGAMIFLSAFPSADVTVQIANAGAFGGGDGVVSIAGPYVGVDGDPRIGFTTYGTGARYTGVEFIRIIFQKTSGNWSDINAPRLNEFFIGRGRVFSIGWAFGSDLSPNHGEHSSFDAKSGEETRYIHHYGRHVEDSSQVLSSVSLDGLDDAATARLLASESRSFKRPVLYIPRPVSALSRALLGFGPREGITMPQTDYDNHEFAFPFWEQPNFRLQEAAA